MDSETLERLLIDASLGALSADAEAMLRAYLKREPSAARQAAAFELTARLARLAMPSPAPATLPPFPARAIQAAQRRRDATRIARQGLAMAACVLLGIGISALRPGATRHAPALPLLVSNDAPSAGDAGRNTGGFWSTQKWYDRAARASQSATGGAIWHSPIQRPSLGGNT